MCCNTTLWATQLRNTAHKVLVKINCIEQDSSLITFDKMAAWSKRQCGDFFSCLGLFVKADYVGFSNTRKLSEFCHILFWWHGAKPNLILGVVYKWQHDIWGRGYQGFCDNSTEALMLKRVMMGGRGCQKLLKLRDVINVLPLNPYILVLIKFNCFLASLTLIIPMIY